MNNDDLVPDNNKTSNNGNTHVKKSYFIFTCLIFLATVFYIVPKLFIPAGLLEALDVHSQTHDILKESVILFGACFAILLLIQLVAPRSYFIMLALVFGSFFYFNLMDLIWRDTDILYPNLFEYKVICLGVSYILLGRYLEMGKHGILTGPLYFIGAFFILSQTSSLSGFYLSMQGFWAIINIILIVLFFYLSVVLKSKSFFFFAAIFSFFYFILMQFQLSEVPLLQHSVLALFILLGYLAIKYWKK